MKRSSLHTERGSGLVGTLFGATVFLAFLLLSTHVLVGLYATSVSTAVVWDAARQAATANADVQAMQSAEASARHKLQGLEQVQFQWHQENDQLGLRLIARRPSLLPPELSQRTSLTTIDRTVWVRMEVER